MTGRWPVPGAGQRRSAPGYGVLRESARAAREQSGRSRSPSRFQTVSSAGIPTRAGVPAAVKSDSVELDCARACSAARHANGHPARTSGARQACAPRVRDVAPTRAVRCALVAAVSREVGAGRVEARLRRLHSCERRRSRGEALHCGPARSDCGRRSAPPGLFRPLERAVSDIGAMQVDSQSELRRSKTPVLLSRGARDRMVGLWWRPIGEGLPPTPDLCVKRG
jgi:hypothetical protein